MLTIIKKISNEINEKNRPDIIETFKDVLVGSFELTVQEKEGIQPHSFLCQKKILEKSKKFRQSFFVNEKSEFFS